MTTMPRRLLPAAVMLAGLTLAPSTDAQTTYYVNPLTAVNVGVDGTTNMTTLVDRTVTGGSSNQNRAMTNNTAPTGTTQWRVREGGTNTRTNQEYLRAYTTVFASATSISANATAYADFYMNTTGTSVTAKATLYEYSDATGLVGAAKGTASFTGNATITTRQTMNNVSFGNAAFTVTAGNRLLVIYLFDTNNCRPAYLWGQAGSTTPSGHQHFTATQTAVATTTVGNGTNPANASLCPGGAATMLDAFTLQTSSGSNAVTAATVSLAAGTAAGLSLVEITNDAGGTVYGSAANPASDTVPITLTGVTATATSTQYKVRVTPKTHANMPAVPGSTYSVTGTVTAITCTNAKAYSDTASATVTVDNASPAVPAWGTNTPGNAQVVLNWTNPVDADFSQVVILRNTVAFADTPVEGTTYVQGNTVGTSTVRYVGSLATFTDTGLTNGTAYYYRIFARDTCGNYSAGVAAGPYTPIAPIVTVTPGTPSASASSCTSINVSAPFTGDTNTNSTTTFSRGISVTGPWTAICSGVTGSTPRVCASSGLTGSTQYWYQVTFADADGVVGTNPQVTAPVTTPACTVNNTTIGTVTATVASCTSVRVTATFTGDGDQDGTATIQYGATAAPGTWTNACVVSGPSPRQCTVPGLAASTLYSFRALFADADGVVGTNPTTGIQATTTACGGDTVAPTITLLAPSKDAVLSGIETVKVQVWDAVGVFSVQGQVDGTGAAGFTLGFAANANYSCGSGCTVYQYSLPAQTAGTHYVAVRATDAAGNASVVTIPFRAVAATTGAGNLLRRTQGSQLCVDCHNIQTHNSQNTSTGYGNWSTDCATCHTPHATKNIFLVREQIDTPNSGRKNVDFRTSNGVTAYGHATPQVSGNGVNVCEVCHTRTKNSDSTARSRNNSSTDWTKHYTSACTGCHTHGKGFAAGESEGGATCAGCHADIWNGMNGAVAKTSKHTIGNVLGTNDAFTDSGITWGSPLSGNLAAARSCLNMCHHDHPHTLTSPVTATHENNVYMDATSTVSRAATARTSASKDKTDFQAAQTNGGMCVSCHRNPVVAGGLTIDKAGYDASAHDYTNFSTYGAWTYTQHDGGVFNRNCTKCHADRNDTRPGDSAIPFGAVHFSNYPDLLAGTKNPNGVTTDFVCYNCHGNGTAGTNLSGKDIATQIAKTRNHPANADNVHNTVTEFGTAAFGNTLGVTGRHSNCIDCHDSHRAKAGTAASPGNLAGPPLEGAWGAQLSINPAFWADTTAANFTKQTLVAGTSLEATLCFKCHTRYYWGTTATSGRGVPPAAPSGGTYTAGTAAFTNGSATVTGTGTTWAATSHVGWVIRNNANGTWHLVTAVGSTTSLTIAPAASFAAAASAYTLQMAETDVAKEFNPANVGNFAGTWAANETAGGFHPVLANAGSNLGRVATANLTTTGGFTWGAAGTNLMSCTDCHESNTTTDPNGPHGSTASFILRGPNTTWSAATIQGAAGMPAGTFCMNCHSQSFASTRFPTHYSRSDHRVACWNCHAAVPHGGPRPGMLIAPGGAAAGVGGTIAGWDTTPPYWGMGTSTGKLYIASYPTNNTGSWGQNNCGCNGTGH